jgi:hypothetical protein
MDEYTDRDIELLIEEVHRQRILDAKYAREKQRVYDAKQQRGLYEIISEVVQKYFGRPIKEVIAALQGLFSSP